MSLYSYLPQDRLRALARGDAMPDRTSGTVLFGDISGFTALTESLRESLGARQGAEELSKQLGAAYSVMIAEVEKYGGSVIDFAGDAMMCWFESSGGELIRGSGYDGPGSAARALNSALGMQLAISSFPALGLKVAITSGEVRRFVVGDQEIQQLDVLAGATVARASLAEHQTVKGDVVVDEPTAKMLGDSLVIKEWREDNETRERVALVSEFTGNTTEIKTATSAPLDIEILKSWVHHTVYEREISTQSAFLTEFRPCAALFVRFTGIDYDADDARDRLDEFIRSAQFLAEHYEGALLQLTIGDKGSYAYINFGAMSLHEDDARRAVKTALELMKVSRLPLQVGITQGLMRVGAYGGMTRASFGAFGDDVNLAARLMMAAAEGEILSSGHVHQAVRDEFTFEPRPPASMKGKAQPLPVFAVTGERQRHAVRLQEPDYALPMVGRQAELKTIEAKLDLAAEGRGQIIGIMAEAGLGKSRLVAEVIRSARRKGFVGFGGACQSDGIDTPYLAWKSIWQAFFDVDSDLPLRKQIRLIEGEIEDRAPSRLEAMPLLNAVLDLNIPENDFTLNLEPKIRQSALHALLEECLKAATQDRPTLIVLEDLHWIDSLSYDLLEGLARALAGYAACFVLAYRPPQLLRLQAPRLEALPQFTRVELHELTITEGESAIRAKLAQLYPSRRGALPGGLVDKLMMRSQGNPFYLEELLNYVRDRGLDPANLQHIELPDSLHTLILSRIDQLSEQEKSTLRVASIIGRLFRAKWLAGYYPDLGSFRQVKIALDALATLDITPLAISAHLPGEEAELLYLFKHIVTHEVTYESLPFSTRARLHEQLASYLENLGVEIVPQLDTIAFHYERSENKEKKKEYLLRAGEAAQKNFANDSALAYYGKLLPLLEDEKEQMQIHLQRGKVLELMGKWDEAENDYHAVLVLSKNAPTQKTNAQFALGKLNRLRGDLGYALEWLAQAKEGCTALEDTAGLERVLIETGLILFRKGEHLQASEKLSEGLALARKVGDKLNAAQALNENGSMAFWLGDFPAAQALYEESLALRREIDDKQGISASLNNLGMVAQAQGDSLAARALYEESLILDREMGDKQGIATGSINLGTVALEQGEYAAARAIFEESLRLDREMGDKLGIAFSLVNLGLVFYIQGDYPAAGACYKEALSLCEEMDQKALMAVVLHGLGMVALAENSSLARDYLLHSLRLRQEMGLQRQQVSGLIGMAMLAFYEGKPQFAAQLLGAVDTSLKALKSVPEPIEKSLCDQTLLVSRKALGETAFQSAWEQGSHWTLDETVDKALAGSEA